VVAARIQLLGSCPSEFEDVAPPSKPDWMEKAGLNFQYFEHEPRFDVAWVVLTTRLRGTHLRAGLSLDIGLTGRAPDRRWVQAVLDCAEARELAGDDAQRWARYVGFAKRSQ
jgi:hypothetical protein